MAFTPDKLIPLLQSQSRMSRLLVAFSGGMDSHVLLHALCQIQDEIVVPVSAVYADHGLQAESAKWAEHCRQVCEALNTPFQSLALTIHRQPGESLEAAAREARYAAFSALVGEGDLLVTAHHQDDQAETLLLQLLRGAGPAGLAAMPASKAFASGCHIRPLLAFSHDDLRQYAQQCDLRWIEDSSNQNDAFDRNYLRNKVIPLIKQRWPSMNATMARSASHCAEAVEVLNDDVKRALDKWLTDDVQTLPVAPLLEMTDAQLKHLLRGWIERLGLPAINHHKLENIRSNLLNAGPDRMPVIAWSGGELRRYQGKVYLGQPLKSFDSTLCLPWPGHLPLRLPADLGEISLVPSPWGLCKDKVTSGCCEIRFRQGGETLRPAGRGISITLKQLFQEHSIPPWLRDRIPLLYIDKELAAVSDFCFAEPFIAQKCDEALKAQIN